MEIRVCLQETLILTWAYENTLNQRLINFLQSLGAGLHLVCTLMTPGLGDSWPMPAPETTICNASLPSVQNLVQRTSSYAQIRPLSHGTRTVDPRNLPILRALSNLATQ